MNWLDGLTQARDAGHACVLAWRESAGGYVYIDDEVVSVNSHEQNLEKFKGVFKRFR